jgi:hypothetical protein
MFCTAGEEEVKRDRPAWRRIKLLSEKWPAMDSGMKGEGQSNTWHSGLYTLP